MSTLIAIILQYISAVVHVSLHKYIHPGLTCRDVWTFYSDCEMFHAIQRMDSNLTRHKTRTQCKIHVTKHVHIVNNHVTKHVLIGSRPSLLIKYVMSNLHNYNCMCMHNLNKHDSQKLPCMLYMKERKEFWEEFCSSTIVPSSLLAWKEREIINSNHAYVQLIPVTDKQILP